MGACLGNETNFLHAPLTLLFAWIPYSGLNDRRRDGPIFWGSVARGQRNLEAAKWRVRLAIFIAPAWVVSPWTAQEGLMWDVLSSLASFTGRPEFLTVCRSQGIRVPTE